MENGGAGDFSAFPLPDFLSELSTLKPKLDSIFAEVEQNLPDIDFEVSDVSNYISPCAYNLHLHCLQESI